MNAEQQQRMYAQASSVVNGFTRVRDQQARDVLTLLAVNAQLEHRLGVLRKAVEEHAQQPGSFAQSFDALFKDIFDPNKAQP